MLTYFKAILIC